MDVVAKADRLERAGRDIYHLEVGQPQSSAPQAAIAVATAQLAADRCGYTAARGEPPLLDAIAKKYEETLRKDMVAHKTRMESLTSEAIYEEKLVFENKELDIDIEDMRKNII